MAASLVYCSCPGFCPWSLCFVYYLPKQSLQNHKPDWVTTLCATDHLLTHREHQVLTALSHSDPCDHCFPLHLFCSLQQKFLKFLAGSGKPSVQVPCLATFKPGCPSFREKHCWFPLLPLSWNSASPPLLGPFCLVPKLCHFLTGGHGSVWNPHYLEECLEECT